MLSVLFTVKEYDSSSASTEQTNNMELKLERCIYQFTLIKISGRHHEDVLVAVEESRA